MYIMRLVMLAMLIGLAACASEPSASASVKVDGMSVSTNKSSAAVKAINSKRWISGSANCSLNKDPAIDVFAYDQNSYILRQNKCLDYEAPFIYVLFGKQKVVVVDTGATEDASKFPLYQKVQTLIGDHPYWSKQAKAEILVLHSHSHGDHKAADGQFSGQANVTLVEPSESGVRGYFGFKDWPNETAKIDLGARTLTIIPIPGHQDESIAIYDSQTQWLLTGDTVYPGRLYVFDWEDFAASIKRLSEFSHQYPVSAVLGAHIEMSTTAGRDYPVGTTYQPNETGLALEVAELEALNQAMQGMGDKVQEYKMAKFIVSPQGKLKKALGKFLGLFN